MKNRNIYLLKISRELLKDVRNLIKLKTTKRKPFDLKREISSTPASLNKSNTQKVASALSDALSLSNKSPSEKSIKRRLSRTRSVDSKPISTESLSGIEVGSVSNRTTFQSTTRKRSKARAEKEKEEELKKVKAQERAERKNRRQEKRKRNILIRELKKQRIAWIYRRLRKMLAFTPSLRKVIHKVLLTEEVLNTVQPPRIDCSINFDTTDETTDYRVNWLQEKVLNYFNFDSNLIFIRMLQRKEGKYNDIIKNFIYSRFKPNMENAVLFFYESTYQKNHYKIVRVHYESEAKNQQEAEIKDDLNWYSSSDILKAGSSSFINNRKDNTSSQALTEEVVKVPATAYIPVKYKKSASQLHLVTIKKMCSILNRGLLFDQNFFYVMRKPVIYIPCCDTYQEAYAQMPKYFHVGNFKIKHLAHQFYMIIKIMHHFITINLKEPDFRFDTNCHLRDQIYKFTSQIQDSSLDDILWSYCSNGKFLFHRYCFENNRLPMKCYRTIKEENTVKRIREAMSLTGTAKEPTDPILFKQKLLAITAKVLEYQTGAIQSVSEVRKPHEMAIDRRMRFPYLHELMLKLQTRTEWFHTIMKFGSSFHFNVMRYAEKHRDIKSMCNDKQLLNKFKELRKHLKNLKTYISSEPPKQGIFELFRHWKKKEYLIYPVLLRIEAPTFQFVLKAVIENFPELGSPFLEDVNYLKVMYKRAKLYSISLKGVIVVCQKMYKTVLIDFNADLFYEFLKRLRRLWVTTIYMNNPEHFIDLMSRVHHVILVKTKQILEINHFLSMPSLKAQKTAVQVVYLMKAWRDTFFEFFTLIELDCAGIITSMTLPEFSLMIDISNMVKMAYDLFYLAKHSNRFTNLFNRRLESIFKEYYKVDVWNLTCSNSTFELCNTNYDIFDFANDKRWDNILRLWYQNLPILEKRSKLLLDYLFKNLRSSVTGTKFLLSLKSSYTTKGLYAHLMGKFKYCTRKFVDEVSECLIATGEGVKDCTAVAYRSQPAASATIIWVENLMEDIFPQFKYVVKIYELWKKNDEREMKHVYTKFLHLCHIQEGMKLAAFMNYRLQFDFRYMKYLCSGNINILFEGPDDLSHHYSHQATDYMGKFLSLRETTSEKPIRKLKKAITFRKGLSFEFFNKLEPDCGKQLKDSEIDSNDVLQDVINYFKKINEAKISQDKKINNIVHNLVKSYYKTLVEKKNNLVKEKEKTFTVCEGQNVALENMKEFSEKNLNQIKNKKDLGKGRKNNTVKGKDKNVSKEKKMKNIVKTRESKKVEKKSFRRIILEYLLYEIFLNTGKISTSFLPRRTIMRNISVTETFAVSDFGDYIYFSSSFREPDTNEVEISPLGDISTLPKVYETPNIVISESLRNQYFNVAKLVTHGTLKDAQYRSPKLLLKQKQGLSEHAMKYSFLSKLNKWQDKDLKYAVETGSAKIQFPFYRELIMLAFIREMINECDLKTLMTKVETYNENRSLMPLIRNIHELNPFFEFMLMSAIYRNLNKKQLRFLETMFIIFQQVFFVERNINSLYTFQESSENESENLSPCNSSLSSSNFDYAYEVAGYTFENAYFDEQDNNYVSDEVFGLLLTLPDFICFLHNSFIDCEFLSDFQIFNLKSNSARNKCSTYKHEGKILLGKECLMLGTDDDLDVVIDFVLENFGNLMDIKKINQGFDTGCYERHKESIFSICDNMFCPASSNYPRIFHKFDEIYSFDAQAKFGRHEEEYFIISSTESFQDNLPTERPVLTSLRQTSAKEIIQESRKMNDDEDNVSDVNSSLSSLINSKGSTLSGGEEGSLKSVIADEAENVSLTDKQESKFPAEKFLKKRTRIVYLGDEGLFSESSPMLFIDNMVESFRCYCSFTNNVSSTESTLLLPNEDNEPEPSRKSTQVLQNPINSSSAQIKDEKEELDFSLPECWNKGPKTWDMLEPLSDSFCDDKCNADPWNISSDQVAPDWYAKVRPASCNWYGLEEASEAWNLAEPTIGCPLVTYENEQSEAIPSSSNPKIKSMICPLDRKSRPVHPRHLKPVESAFKALDMISNIPFIHQKFLKASTIRNLYKFCDEESNKFPQKRAFKNFSGLNPRICYWYEAQKYYRDIAKDCVRRYAKCPSIGSTNKYLERLFTPYTALILQKQSKNNEIAQMQLYLSNKMTKRNKFLSWTFSFMQDEFPMLEEIRSLFPEIKDNRLQKILRPIISRLNYLWNGYTFLRHSREKDKILEFTWRRICLKYPELCVNMSQDKDFISEIAWRRICSKCPKLCVNITPSLLHLLYDNQLDASCENPNEDPASHSGYVENVIDDLGLESVSDINEAVSFNVEMKHDDHIKAMYNDNCISNNLLDKAVQHEVSEKPEAYKRNVFKNNLNSGYENVKQGLRTIEDLKDKFKLIIYNRLNYRKKCTISFTPNQNFYELVLNSKHFIESGNFNDSSIKFICNDYPYFVNKLHSLLHLVSCYNNFVQHLNEEESYFFREFIGLQLAFSMYKNLKNYLHTRMLVPEAQNFIEKSIPIINQTRLRQLRETSNILTLKYLKIKRHNWFEVPRYSQPLKTYLKSMMNRRNITHARLMRLVSSACYHFKVLDYLVDNNCPGKIDNPKLFMYFENYEMMGISSAIRSIRRNTQFLEKVLFYSGFSKPVLYLMFRGTTLYYDRPLKEIADMLLFIWTDFVKRYKYIPRWKSGTCEKVESVKIISKTAVHRYSVYDEWLRMKEVQETLNTGMKMIKKVIDALADYRNRWRIFNKIWRAKRLYTIKYMFLHKNFDLTEIMYALNFFIRYNHILKTTEGFVDVEGFRIEISQPINALISKFEKFSMSISVEVRRRILNFCKNFEKALLEVLNNIDDKDQFVETMNMIDAIGKYTELEYRFKCGLTYVKRARLLVCRFGLKFGSDIDKKIINLKEHFQFASILMFSMEEDLQSENCEEKYLRVLIHNSTNFREKCQSFAQAYWFLGPRTCCDNLSFGLELIKFYEEAFDCLVKEKELINSTEKLIGCRLSEFPLFDAIYEDFKTQYILYKFYEYFKEDYTIWKGFYWHNFDQAAVQTALLGILSAFKSLPVEMRSLPVGTSIRKLLNDVDMTLPLFEKLKCDELKARHWKQLRRRTGYGYFDNKNPYLRMAKLFKWKLHKYSEILDEILEFALNEAVVKHKLINIAYALGDLVLQIVPYYNERTYRGIALDTNDEVLIAIDDYTLELQSLTSSPYSAPFLTNIHRWEMILLVVHEVLTEWLSVQRKWRYLESVFISGDLRNQLPDMAKKFDEVDKTYLLMTAPLKRQRKVLSQCLKPDTFNKFTKLSNILDECQKTLVNYLDTKRNSFPRFYFISNDELLSILAAQSPEGIQDQMFKIFDNVCLLRFRPQKSRSIRKRIVTALISCENEVLNFKTFRSTFAAVERWMNGIVNEMRKSLKILTKESIVKYATVYNSRIKWMSQTLGVCVMATNKTFWTANVELAFEKFKRRYNKAMKDLLDMLKDQIDKIVLQVRGPLIKNERKKLITVLIVDVHSKDIVGKLVSESITKRTSFEWECQLRYYWKARHRSLRLRQCSGFFQYGYEYMGLNGRLVITPLTDRIFLTITQALALKLGGAPAGPAGTGKTETTKDLAKAMGRLCMVTNCGENMDYIQFGKILMGLCQSGAWGCFDEFNRIDISVLSVITTQLQVIRAALLNEAVNYFKFEGYKIYLDRKNGIFITMNPGYAGRTELPETIKALFRPVVCIVPDLEHICLIMLFSEGFLTAKILAKKMTLLYSLSKDRLSKQSHYDFGLRSLKPVLTVAGDLKRSSPELNEEFVIMRALRDMNQPKLVPEDEGLFLELIDDLFPGIHCERVTYPEYNAAVEAVLSKMNYVIISAQINKVIQVYETMMTRHSTAIVGPTRSGKTVVISTLCEAQILMGLPTMMVVLNPKAFTVDELYGLLDPKTRDWIDGLLSNAFREMNQPIKKPERRYLMFDGDVDALWIENMNSVMDDNKILTLTSGERMRLLDHCALLFEVGDLRYASPATVSRCGVVFVDSEIVGYNPYWERWLYRRTDQEEIYILSSLYEKFIPKALTVIFKGSLVQKTKPLSFIIPQNEVNLIAQLCYILESTLPSPPKPRLSMFQESTRESQLPRDSKGEINISEQKSLPYSKTVTKQEEQSATDHDLHATAAASLIDSIYTMKDSDESVDIKPTYMSVPIISCDFFSYKVLLLLTSPNIFIYPYNTYATRNRLALKQENYEDHCIFQCFRYKTPLVLKYSSSSKVPDACRCRNPHSAKTFRNKLFADPKHHKSVQRSHLEKVNIRVLDPLSTRFVAKWRLLPRAKRMLLALKQITEKNNMNLFQLCKHIFFSRGNHITRLWQEDFRKLMKQIAKDNIVKDMIQIMRMKYSSDVSCKLGDNILKYFKRIIKKEQKGKHLSTPNFCRYYDVEFLRNIQVSQYQQVMRMKTKRKIVKEKPSSYLFRLKESNFILDEISDEMLPENELLTDWMGSYWNDKLQNFEEAINVQEVDEAYAQNKLQEYRVNLENLGHYQGQIVDRFPIDFSFQDAVNENEVYITEKEKNELMGETRSKPFNRMNLMETYALRKLSFQYRAGFIKQKGEAVAESIEERKRLSLQYKQTIDTQEAEAKVPKWKSWTRKSSYAPQQAEEPRRGSQDPAVQERKTRTLKIRAIFVEAMYASLGATLVERDRAKFDDFVKSALNIPEYPDTVENQANFRFIPCKMPLLYNYKTDLDNNCWVAWSDVLRPYIHNKNKKFDEIFVPTEESSRIGLLLQLMQSVQRPVILVGESGTAKTAIMMEFLRNISLDYVKLTLTFSSRTTSLDVQRNIESSLDKINKHTLGPPAGKEMIIFIDDLNMPQFDEYGTQQPIALLKLTVEKNGLFDRERDLSWKTLQNVTFIGAMGMTARSDQVVDPRFTSHFCIFNLTPPSDDTINRIYISILNGHTDDFSCELHTVTPDIMRATLAIYKFLREDIPPSPVRFHYVFSLRDLSRVTAGLLQTTPNVFNSKKEFVRGWRNELMRVFYDRLCLAEDQVKVCDYIDDVIDEIFSGMKRFVRSNPLIFGDYENFLNPDEPRFYKDLGSFENIYKIFSDILEDYNTRFIEMDLVLFEDALDHLTRIHRVLRLNRGNLLAIGVGGCGKRSLITLASYAAGCKMFQINLCKGYNESFFKDDLKKLHVMLGVDQINTTFLFTSSHIVQEDFLEYINSILTVGYIPALFSDEDKDGIINKVRKNARAAGCARTKGEVWNYFLDTCKNSLHMVLSMSPLGNALRVRCRSFPSLVNNSTIDWIFPWPTEALQAVASNFLPNDLFTTGQRKLIIDHIVFTHQSVVNFADEFLIRYNRTCFITPKHYLDFIKVYIKFVKEKVEDNLFRTHEYELGLQKMVEAYITVEQISAETLKQKEIVERQNINCELLMKDLDAATIIVKEKESVAKARSKEVHIQSIEIEKHKKEAEKALSTALPALNQARVALDQLNKNDITEIRSFATPPQPVQVVCECILILCNYTEIDWKTAKGMMADPNFLNTLKEMNVNKITRVQQKNVREHLAKSAKMDQMAVISTAGYGLLMFIQAVLNYCNVYRIVKPKQEKVEMLEKKLTKALQNLEAINAEVRELEQKLHDLNAEYEIATAERQRLKEEMDLMLNRLAIANKLLHGLSSENERWKKEHAALKSEYEKIIGNCLMTSSFLAYTGAFNWELRQEMIHDAWRKNIAKLKIPFSSNYQLELELMDEMSISKLYTEGLPPDELSLQNALLVLCSSRFPLCIDPQQQALRWLIKREKASQPKILTFDDKNYLTVLETSIRSGVPVIFKDVEYVDPIIEHLLEKNIREKRGQFSVLIGNKELEYHTNFRLYLVSKMPNPQFESWIYTKSTVVNCIVTLFGLEDQLLNVVARKERPDLEEARERLIEQTNLQKQSVKFFEKTLLIELANATGNLLDNTVLIQTLESTKIRVTEMQKDLTEAEKNKLGIETTRNEYRPVAKRGALLYFVLYDMSAMNSMYIYSLDSYLKVFEDALRRTVISILISVRVKKYIAILTKEVYDYGCNGLFERDKLLFSFQIALRLQQSVGEVTDEEFVFLIKGDSSIDKCKVLCPAKWFPAERWKDLVKLNTTFSTFEDVLTEFENKLSSWEKWYNLAAPEKGKLPYEKFTSLKPFERLMLFRCLRVDRISECIPDYINSIMGPYFNKPPLISLEQIVSASTPDEPVMFVLCPGANPIPKLIKCAEKERSGALGSEDIVVLTISLGQGQEPRATKMFLDGRRRGYWIVFENCHLLPFFIAAIEKKREKLENQPHPTFRLWYTTEPTEKFPLSVLQTTSRVVLEIAESFKLNLARTVKSIDKMDFREQVRIHPSFGHIIYVLAFFHAVLLERKKFGQVGFNINYDFSECDFEACYQLIKRYLKKTSHNMRKSQSTDQNDPAYNQYLYDRVPWEILRYLIGEIIYGGRVIDYYDRRTVSTYLEEYMDNFIYQSLSTFCFFKRMTLKYPVPLYNNLTLYNKQIRHLPDTTFPGVFGLHPNVEIAYNDAKTTKFWKNLMSLQPSEGSASKVGAKKEAVVNQVWFKIKDVVPKTLYDVSKEKLKYEDIMQTQEIIQARKLPRDPTVIILFQELGMFNVLIESLQKSLVNLKKAMSGEIAMDALLDNIFECLYEGDIPTPWRKLIPQTKKSLGQWMTHFKNRIQQYDEWLKEFKTSTIWLSGLHVPQSYLTAVMQRTTRLQGWSLDQTALYSFITKTKKSKKIKAIPHLGCYVRDLFIQGARWDSNIHQLQPPRRKIQVEPLPILAIRPIKIDQRKFVKSFQTPVYTTSDRRNAMGVGFVFEADIQTNSHYSVWVMKGVCMLLNKE